MLLKRIVRRKVKNSVAQYTQLDDPSTKHRIRLDKCIELASAVKSMGELAPFPYIKVAADAVLRILQPFRVRRDLFPTLVPR